MTVELEGIKYYCVGGFLDVLEDFNKLLREKLGVSIGLSYLNGLPVPDCDSRFPPPTKPTSHKKRKRRPFGTPDGSWRNVLGIIGNPSVAQVQRRFRALALKYHPDRGGMRDQFEEILKARNAAIREVSRDANGIL